MTTIMRIVTVFLALLFVFNIPPHITAGTSNNPAERERPLARNVIMIDAVSDETSGVIITQNTDGHGIFRGEGIGRLGQIGQPAIPYHSVTVLLPPNVDTAGLRASIIGQEWETVAGTWDIQPVPPLATWDGEKEIIIWPEGKTFANGKDVESYESDAFFPAQPVVRCDPIDMRNWKMAQVFYSSFRYNATTGELNRLSKGTIQVEFDKLSPASAIGPVSNIGLRQVKNLSANFDKVIGEYGEYAPSSPGRYVIITTTAIQAASSELGNFVAAKKALGFTVQVVTEGTWGGGSGNTTAENIRGWLQGNYEELNIEYVLLVGNPHPDTGDVPMKMCYPQRYDPGHEECPTDFYYAELTSDWNTDDDEKYGEYNDDFEGEPPRGSEVFVGRIPYYGNISDLDGILAKIVAYENSSPEDALWRRNVLLPMEPSDDFTPGYRLGEEIRNNVLVPEVWGSHRVYDDTYGLTPAPETVPCNITNVTDAWNGSNFGGVFWWTHGSDTRAADVMDLSHAATLDDAHPAFTFQCSCLNGYPEAPNNLQYSLLINGCVSTVGSSRVSWYFQGQTSFAGTATNSGMTYEYASRIITEGMPAGEALGDLKLDVPCGMEALWMNYLDFNLYGCPSVGLFSMGAGPSAVAFSSESYIIDENDGLAGITVNLFPASGDTVTVDYASIDGTAISPEDYTAVGDTLIFAPGQTSRSFDIPIVDDDIIEGDESLSLILSSPVNSFLSTPSTATLTITENPIIEVYPTEFEVTLPVNSTDEYTLTISNLAEEILTFQASDKGAGCFTEETTSPTGGADPPRLPPTDVPGRIVMGSTDQFSSASISYPVTNAPDEIIYDDGTAEKGFAWETAGGMFAVQFTPPSYPTHIETARVFIVPDLPDSNHEEFAIRVYDDDGLGGSPGTLISGPVYHTASDWGWTSIGLSELGIVIESGDFYIAYEQLSPHPDCEALAIDESEPKYGRSWDQIDSAWQLLPDDNCMIRCAVEPDIPWLDENPKSGSATVGDPEEIVITIDSTGLTAGGDYCADIIVGSNDPHANPTIIPVLLHVTFEPGDANEDGGIDVLDWYLVRDILLGIEDPTLSADADGDGDVDIFDWVKIKRVVMGLP